MIKKNILIIGAGVAGRLLAQDIQNCHADLNVVGFVDDKKIRSKRKLGSVKDLPRLLADYHIDEVIVAIPSADGVLIRQVLLNNLHSRVPIRIVPREQQTLSRNEVSYSNVKDLEPEDFLGRPLIKKDINQLRRYYQHKVAFITGGAGSIGSEITRQLIELGADLVIIYDQSEYLSYQLIQSLQEQAIAPSRYKLIVGDIKNQQKMAYLMKKWQPDLVFHAAAYKHVHLMQHNIDEAVATNVLGTISTAQAAIAARIKRFVFVSTDKVVNPQSIMGATKSIAEQYIRSLPPKPTLFSIVRFGNVINSHGSVLPLFARQIQDHRYVTLTNPQMKRFFMSIREAASLVLTSARAATAGDIFLLDMGDLISLWDVVLCVIRSKNFIPQTDVRIKQIGSRQGEKISEELFTAAEKKHLARTRYENVWRLDSPSLQPEQENMVANLAAISNSYPNRGKLLKYLINLFPSMPR